MWNALPFMQKLLWIQNRLFSPCFDFFSWFSHWDRRFHFACIGFDIVVVLCPWNAIEFRLRSDASTTLIVEFHWNHRDLKSSTMHMFNSCMWKWMRKATKLKRRRGILFTLQAIEQKRLGKSCMYLPQASQVPPNFNFVDGFESFDCGRGFKWTAFSPFIL